MSWLGPPMEGCPGLPEPAWGFVSAVSAASCCGFRLRLASADAENGAVPEETWAAVDDAAGGGTDGVPPLVAGAAPVGRTAARIEAMSRSPLAALGDCVCVVAVGEL